MEDRECSECDTGAPSLTVNAVEKTVQRWNGNGFYHNIKTPSTEPTTLRQRTVGRKVPDGGQQ